MSLVGHVLEFSELVENERTPLKVLPKLVEEVGELSTEIAIDGGISYKNPSSDGIVGEGVDIIIAVLDIIKLHNPNITEADLLKIAVSKCNKWYTKVNKQK